MSTSVDETKKENQKLRQALLEEQYKERQHREERYEMIWNRSMWGIAILFGFYLLCLSHVGANEIGIFNDVATGEITTSTRTGIHITHPLVFARSFSTIPQIVKLESGAKIVPEKLVRFKAENVEDFLKIQGFDYSSRESVILRGYAFSGRSFPFLEIIEDPSTYIAPK